jgi:hypothetical protein
VHFLDVDEDIAARPLLQFDFELVDLGAFAADDDARSISIELTPADFSLSLSSFLSFTSSSSSLS